MRLLRGIGDMALTFGKRRPPSGITGNVGSDCADDFDGWKSLIGYVFSLGVVPLVGKCNHNQSLHC